MMATARHQCVCRHTYDVDEHLRAYDAAARGVRCPKCGELFDGGGPPAGLGPNNGIRIAEPPASYTANQENES
jgi:hypothetical protein